MEATQSTQFTGKMEWGKYVGKPIATKLLTLLNEVRHFNPDFTYMAKDTRGFGDNVNIDEIAVLLGNQVVGVIGVSNRYRRNESEDVFVARSENIKRERAITITSKHLKVVMKEIREAFKPRSNEKRIAEVTDTISTQLLRMKNNANSHVRSSVQNAASEVLMYLYKLHTGSVGSTELPSDLLAKLGRNWETYLDSARISESVVNDYNTKRGICVRIERDGKLAVVDLATDTLNEHDTTYDLTSNYQEKITMLKLMDEAQPIEHVGARFTDWNNENGVRCDYDYFFLVSGATYTNC